MNECILEGKPVTPDMPGICQECSLYLSTCKPYISKGFLVGAECDYDHCCECPCYEDCSK